MKRKAISRILAISLSVAMCAKSIPIYAAEEIGTSAAADFFAEDSIENQSLNEGDAETNAETNTESNTETNTKADATTGISEAYTLEESNSATTSEETVTDEDGFWSGESETVESSANGSGGWESAEMDGAEAGDEAVKRDAAAFVSGDVEENVEETVIYNYIGKITFCHLCRFRKSLFQFICLSSFLFVFFHVARNS